MRLLTVEDARARMLAAAPAPRPERVALAEAVGRTLVEPVRAVRDQPPFDASAMDGWAIRAAAAEHERVALRIVGESAAGRPYAGAVGEGEAVRIFTGAPVPPGCTRVVIQEQAERDGHRVRLGPSAREPSHLRPRGGDFRADAELLPAGARLDAWRLALAASAGAAELAVAARARIALLSTGEELAPAGSAALPHQIFDSGGPALRARAQAWGADVRMLAPAGDDEAAILAAVGQAGDAELL
ncbi:MAG: molybdopterin molybdenumtransferase MoeA, partial [Gemmatimonadetes bacterium]|nr:molybdopterin molybdenumtransferase MoeA [Gemmatimonadota bacterium]